MSRFERVEPWKAYKPVPGMRVFGRSESGRFGRLIVKAVEDGQVYYRASTLHHRPAWPFGRVSCGKWWGDIEAADVVAVRVPRGEG